MLRILLLLALPLVAHAAPKVDASIISEVKSLRPGEPAWLGLHLSLEKDWHVYWKNPGDTGKPPAIDWNSQSSVKISPIEWPVPRQFIVGGLMNYGYEGEVLLPFQVTVADEFKGKKVHISGHASWLVCREECIPESQNVELTLPVSNEIPKSDKNYVRAFDLAKAAIPRALPAGSIKVKYTGEYELQIPREIFSTAVESLKFFPDEQDWISPTAPQTLSHNGHQYILRMKPQENFPVTENISGVLTTDTLAVSFRESVKMDEAEGGVLLWSLFAFIGGLILNLMPCVFPVLSIKILAIANSSRDNLALLKRQAYFYALGILISFWAIAGILLLLQTLGANVGWGFQLQIPWFVAGLAALFFLMALNLLSLFEFGGSWMGVGQQLTNRDGVLGSFFTGVLAVVVATPCSAPFMGTAVGAALLKPGVGTLSIFTFLALGLASPYLMLPFFPALVQHMPRPGVWMNRLRSLLALPLLATVVWLIWVLSAQTSFVFVAFVVVGLAAMLFFTLWYNESFPSRAQVALLGAFFFAAVLVGFTVRSQERAHKMASSVVWESFSEAKVDEARQANRAVFVDFTADWCITCKVNEGLVLNSQSFAELVKKNKVAVFRADWTKEDSEITRVLKKFQRVGVPLYVAYPAGKDSVILPQVLTMDAIREGLKFEPLAK
jgi:thiol:disulfide interchange protein